MTGYIAIMLELGSSRRDNSPFFVSGEEVAIAKQLWFLSASPFRVVSDSFFHILDKI